eukprot:scaffold1028_cov135-Cylindrotheca_fusiformis.AAC.26
MLKLAKLSSDFIGSYSQDQQTDRTKPSLDDNDTGRPERTVGGVEEKLELHEGVDTGSSTTSIRINTIGVLVLYLRVLLARTENHSACQSCEICSHLFFSEICRALGCNELLQHAKT